MKGYRFAMAFFALGLIFAPVSPSPALAADKAKTVTVATDATWPPMEMVDASKNIVGFDIDFLKAVAKEAGFKVVFKNTAWDGIFAGIESISKGQMEAARSLGMTSSQAMRHVILPQAVKTILPPIGNEFVALLKDSSLISILAVSDLLRRGREFASESFTYFETYTMVALIYMIITLFFSKLISLMEEKIRADQ